MRITTTAFLGLTVIVLAIVTAILERQPETGRRAADLANVLVRLDPEKVERIDVEKGTAKTVLVRRGGFWFFSEPEEDRVDAGLVLGLLDKINHLNVVDTIVAGEGELSAAETGVTGERAIKVTFSGSGKDGEKGGVAETVVFGTDAPRAESIYARRDGGETDIMVVDGNPRPWLESPLEALRDRRILGAPVESVVQLVIRQAGGELALQRRITPPQQDWALVSPLSTWANREALDRLLTAIGALRIDEVVVDAKADEAIPNPLPEKSVVLQIQVLGVEKPLNLYLKEIPGAAGGLPLVEARVSDRPAVFRLRSDIISKLPGNANDLRDRVLARIPLEYLDTITIQSRIDPLVFLKAERNSETPFWEVKLNNKLVAANFSAVSALVEAVNDAAILNFASDTAENLAEFGLNPPARRVGFKLRFPGQPLPDGSPGQVQELTRVLNLGWKDNEEKRLFANFEGEPYVYELDPTFINAIPTHPIKWRSLNVLSFNPINLRSITRDLPDRENLKLDYDYRFDSWKAWRSGDDVTQALDPAAAGRLRDRLGSLSATGWYLSLGPAYEALQNPSAQFNIVTSELDPAINEAKEVTYLVKFAPSAANLYFGQIEGSPDVFFLDEKSYMDLIRPVTTARASNP